MDRVIERRDVEKGASVGWKERGGMEGERDIEGEQQGGKKRLT